jgi:hypothetical protein
MLHQHGLATGRGVQLPRPVPGAKPAPHSTTFWASGVVGYTGWGGGTRDAAQTGATWSRRCCAGLSLPGMRRLRESCLAYCLIMYARTQATRHKRQRQQRRGSDRQPFAAVAEA